MSLIKLVSWVDFHQVHLCWRFNSFVIFWDKIRCVVVCMAVSKKAFPRYNWISWRGHRGDMYALAWKQVLLLRLGLFRSVTQVSSIIYKQTQYRSSLLTFLTNQTGFSLMTHFLTVCSSQLKWSKIHKEKILSFHVGISLCCVIGSDKLLN